MRLPGIGRGYANAGGQQAVMEEQMGNESNAAEAAAGQGNDDANQASEQHQFTPITTQDDLNKVIADRIGRERAKFSDYADLKAKADQFDQLEEANKSEIQKAVDKAAKAERERDQAKVETLRLRIAARHNISDEDADLLLTGTDEASLTKQAEALVKRAGDRKKQGNHAPREGANPQTAASDERAFVRDLFRAG